MTKENLIIGFIGAGGVGRGLALALSQRGYRVTGVYSRTRQSAQGLSDRVAGCRVYSTAQALADAVELVFITTPDSAIAALATEIRWRENQGAVHCCGAAGRSLLGGAVEQGAVTGAFHPFQTFAGIDDPEEAVARLSGITFALSADGWLQEFLEGVARDLDSRTINLKDSARPLYHASAVLSCGYLVTLLQSSVRLWEEMGFSPEEAVSALYPLAQSTLNNVKQQGIPASVTGPLVRGDVDTVESHLRALQSGQPDLTPLYAELTRLSLPLAEGRGVPSSALLKLRQLLDSYAANYRETIPEVFSETPNETHRETYNGRSEPCPE